MDVFVIPLDRDRYELYCETSTALFASESTAAGIVGRLRHRLAETLRLAEERRQGLRREPAAATWSGRLQDRVMAWVSERIAEQRLLWNLRGETQVVAAHPQDMTFDQVRTLIDRSLRRDYERHRRWVVIDTIVFLVTFIALGPFFLLIPGVANIPAIYFGFRAVGHFFSMRGAAHGLRHVAWSGRVCEPLDELRDVATLTPAAREARVHDIAQRLQLPHLATFFERVAVHHA